MSELTLFICSSVFIHKHRGVTFVVFVFVFVFVVVLVVA